MLNFIKKLFGTDKPASTTPAVEFHEEIKQQVEAQPFPVIKEKPATKKAPAKIKAVANPAPKKSKKQ
jgi:hypothetical protein